ncbi:MAG: hypothetical protein ABWK01_06285 [Infirmifilum sp.]
MAWIQARLVSRSSWVLGVAVALLSGIMASYAAASLEAARSSLAVALGAREGVGVLYDAGSRFLVTGLVPVEAASLINSSVWSPEVLVPVVVDGSEVLMLRGVDPVRFGGLEQVALSVEGRGWAVLGTRAARLLGASVGDLLVVESSVNGRLLVLKVVGIVDKDPFTDEVLSSLEDAQFLRGCSGGFVSVIRFWGSPRVVERGGVGGLPPPAWVLKLVESGRVGAASSGGVAESYADSLGLSRSAVLSASLLVVSGSLACAASAGYMIVAVNRESLGVLSVLGAGRRALFTRFLSLPTLSFGVAGAAGSLLGLLAASQARLLLHAAHFSLQVFFPVTLALLTGWGVGLWVGLRSILSRD